MPDKYLHEHKDFPDLLRIVEEEIAENEAFLLYNPDIKADFIKRYQTTAALYYKGQPDFDELLNRIKEYIHRL